MGLIVFGIFMIAMLASLAIMMSDRTLDEPEKVRPGKLHVIFTDESSGKTIRYRWHFVADRRVTASFDVVLPNGQSTFNLFQGGKTNVTDLTLESREIKPGVYALEPKTTGGNISFVGSFAAVKAPTYLTIAVPKNKNLRDILLTGDRERLVKRGTQTTILSCGPIRFVLQY